MHGAMDRDFWLQVSRPWLWWSSRPWACEAAPAVSVCTAASCTGIWGFACLCCSTPRAGGQRLDDSRSRTWPSRRLCGRVLLPWSRRVRGNSARAERRARAPASRFRATGAMPLASLLAIICCGDS